MSLRILNAPFMDKGHLMRVPSLRRTLELNLIVTLLKTILFDKKVSIKFFHHSRELSAIVVYERAVTFLARFYDMALEDAIKKAFLNQSVCHLM